MSLLLIDQPVIGQILCLNVPSLRYLRFPGGSICGLGRVFKVQASVKSAPASKFCQDLSGLPCTC